MSLSSYNLTPSPVCKHCLGKAMQRNFHKLSWHYIIYVTKLISRSIHVILLTIVPPMEYVRTCDGSLTIVPPWSMSEHVMVQ